MFVQDHLNSQVKLKNESIPMIIPENNIKKIKPHFAVNSNVT